MVLKILGWLVATVIMAFITGEQSRKSARGFLLNLFLSGLLLSITMLVVSDEINRSTNGLPLEIQSLPNGIYKRISDGTLGDYLYIILEGSKERNCLIVKIPKNLVEIQSAHNSNEKTSGRLLILRDKNKIRVVLYRD